MSKITPSSELETTACREEIAQDLFLKAADG
jgi:hypothetical protein